MRSETEDMMDRQQICHSVARFRHDDITRAHQCLLNTAWRHKKTFGRHGGWCQELLWLVSALVLVACVLLSLLAVGVSLCLLQHSLVRNLQRLPHAHSPRPQTEVPPPESLVAPHILRALQNSAVKRLCLSLMIEVGPGQQARKRYLRRIFPCHHGLRSLSAPRPAERLALSVLASLHTNFKQLELQEQPLYVRLGVAGPFKLFKAPVQGSRKRAKSFW